MKTLILNGSPRKNGATAFLVSELKKRLSGDITEICTYDAGIAPCVDCRYCWTHPECAIGDGMQRVYRLIDEADNIVIASPIYFAELTGSLLQFASRLQFFWVAKKFRGVSAPTEKPRKGAVILVDGGDGYTETSVAMAKRLLRTMGAEYKELVYFSGTDTKNVREDAPTLEKIKKLAATLG